jgi:hypothetical protein
MIHDPLLTRIQKLLEIYSIEEILEILDVLPEEALLTIVEHNDLELPDFEPL